MRLGIFRPYFFGRLDERRYREASGRAGECLSRLPATELPKLESIPQTPEAVAPTTSMDYTDETVDFRSDVGLPCDNRARTSPCP